MKQDTVIVIVKALCYMVVGFTAPLSSALAQWANEGTWPASINWIVIIGACAGSCAGSLLAFLSNSYGNYMKDRKNGDTQIITKP